MVLPDARFEVQMRVGGIGLQPILRAFRRGRVPQARIGAQHSEEFVESGVGGGISEEFFLGGLRKALVDYA